MTAFRRITDTFSVAPQLGPEDIARAAGEGFRTLIVNRPDGESPDAMPIAEARALAEAAGLAFAAIPFSGPPTPEAVDQTATALAAHPAPILAYCRSGTRSCTVWALATAKAGRMEAADILSAASAAGYDLSAMAGTLDRIRREA
ncbi:MAG: TIGR01244 family sulfur transferase [Hyphomonadaceae bacterium]|nr:TIGR01244 family sulfur transferase [Hyphomonadaceae bacterium]